MNPWLILVSLVLLMLPVTDWVAVRILRRAARRSGAIALTERARTATILATATSINCVISAANLAFTLTQDPGFRLDPTVTTALLSVSLILPGVPNIYWLGLYYRSRRRRDP